MDPENSALLIGDVYKRQSLPAVEITTSAMDMGFSGSIVKVLR